jgi:ribonuclease VapC
VIVDASAILAVIFREPGYERLVTTLAAAELAAVGTPTLTEAGIFLEARL